MLERGFERVGKIGQQLICIFRNRGFPGRAREPNSPKALQLLGCRERQEHAKVHGRLRQSSEFRPVGTAKLVFFDPKPISGTTTFLLPSPECYPLHISIDLVQQELRRILSHFKGSYATALKELFPEIKFQRSEFIMLPSMLEWGGRGVMSG